MAPPTWIKVELAPLMSAAYRGSTAVVSRPAWAANSMPSPSPPRPNMGTSSASPPEPPRPPRPPRPPNRPALIPAKATASSRHPAAGTQRRAPSRLTTCPASPNAATQGTSVRPDTTGLRPRPPWRYWASVNISA